MSHEPSNRSQPGEATRATVPTSPDWQRRAETLEAAFAATFWMARRYADMRRTAAPTDYNEQVRAVLALGVTLRPDNGAIYARDGGGRAFDRLSPVEVAACELNDPRWAGDELRAEQCRAEALGALMLAAEALAGDLCRRASNLNRPPLPLAGLVRELSNLIEDHDGHEAIVPMRLLVPILAALLAVRDTYQPPRAAGSRQRDRTHDQG